MQQSREIVMKGIREIHHCLMALKNFDNEKSPPLFSYDSLNRLENNQITKRLYYRCHHQSVK